MQDVAHPEESQTVLDRPPLTQCTPPCRPSCSSSYTPFLCLYLVFAMTVLSILLVMKRPPSATPYTRVRIHLLPARPVPISEVDKSIVIPPRRLHLTLGAMSLADSVPQNSATAPKTLSSALALLTSLRPHVLVILNDQPLRVPLQGLISCARPVVGLRTLTSCTLVPILMLMEKTAGS